MIHNFSAFIMKLLTKKKNIFMFSIDIMHKIPFLGKFEDMSQMLMVFSLNI